MANHILPDMIIDYIAWMRNLDQKLFKKDDVYPLLSSAVFPPTDLLMEHLGLFPSEAIKRMDEHYAYGLTRLIENIAARYGTKPENVYTTNGASSGIYLICCLMLNQGSQIVIESPVYQPLIATPDYIGCKIGYLKRRPPDYLIDLDELSNAITPKTRLVILANPHNPSGMLFSDDYLLKIAETAKARNKNIRILIDEIYHDFVPGQPKPAALLDDCFITLNSLTKVYGLGSIHCGWVIAEQEIIDRLKRLQIVIEGCGSRLLDSFTSLIIEKLDIYLNRSLRITSENRKIMEEHLKPLFDRKFMSGTIPPYGCIYFPKISDLADTKPFTEELAREYKVFVVPGHFFGEPGHIRMGFGAESGQLRRNLQKFVEAVSVILK